MQLPSIWTLLSIAFLGYMFNSIYTLYKLYLPVECGPETSRCLRPALATTNGVYPKFQMRLYTVAGASEQLIFLRNNVDLRESFVEIVNVTVPPSVRRNGTMSLKAYLLSNDLQRESNVNEAPMKIMQQAQFTRYEVPTASAYTLITGADEKQKEQAKKTRPQTHIYSKVQLLAVDRPIEFDESAIPAELVHLLRLDEKRRYLPIFYLDELAFLSKYLTTIDPGFI